MSFTFCSASVFSSVDQKDIPTTRIACLRLKYSVRKSFASVIIAILKAFPSKEEHKSVLKCFKSLLGCNCCILKHEIFLSQEYVLFDFYSVFFAAFNSKWHPLELLLRKGLFPGYLGMMIFFQLHASYNGYMFFFF